MCGDILPYPYGGIPRARGATIEIRVIRLALRPPAGDTSLIQLARLNTQLRFHEVCIAFSAVIRRSKLVPLTYLERTPNGGRRQPRLRAYWPVFARGQRWGVDRVTY